MFIIHGIINAVVKGDADPVDIQIYDIEKAFDALWLEDSMNDLLDTIHTEQQDVKMALLYKGNMVKQNGKTKCHQMHIGKNTVICPDLKIHGHNMEKVLSGI